MKEQRFLAALIALAAVSAGCGNFENSVLSPSKELVDETVRVKKLREEEMKMKLATKSCELVTIDSKGIETKEPVPYPAVGESSHYDSRSGKVQIEFEVTESEEKMTIVLRTSGWGRAKTVEEKSVAFG